MNSSNPPTPTMTRQEVRHVRQSLERIYAGTGFVAVQLDGPTPALEVRYHDPDKMHWTEVGTFPVAGTTAPVLMEVAVTAIENLRRGWRETAARCEAQFIRRGLVTDNPPAAREPELAAS